MPKKFGVNSKKEEGRERKNQKKRDEQEKKAKAAEDEYWKETDKKIISKQQEKKRKEREKEEKTREKQQRKEDLKKEEEELLNKSKNKKEQKYNNRVHAPSKGEIAKFEQERIDTLMKKNEEESSKVVDNPNDEIDTDKEYVNENYLKDPNKVIDISGIDQALSQLKFEMGELDLHPEKRVKQAWNDYLEKQLPIYKEQYPKLKRSQYVNMIYKEFQTSSDNPVYMNNVLKSKKAKEEDEF